MSCFPICDSGVTNWCKPSCVWNWRSGNDHGGADHESAKLQNVVGGTPLTARTNHTRLVLEYAKNRNGKKISEWRCKGTEEAGPEARKTQR